MQTRTIIQILGRAVMVRRGTGHIRPKDHWINAPVYQEFLVDADLTPRQIRRAIKRFCPLIGDADISIARKHRAVWSENTLTEGQIRNAMLTTEIFALGFRGEQVVGLNILGEFLS